MYIQWKDQQFVHLNLKFDKSMKYTLVIIQMIINLPLQVSHHGPTTFSYLITQCITHIINQLVTEEKLVSDRCANSWNSPMSDV